jgi:hypothetical protein
VLPHPAALLLPLLRSATQLTAAPAEHWHGWVPGKVVKVSRTPLCPTHPSCCAGWLRGVEWWVREWRLSWLETPCIKHVWEWCSQGLNQGAPAWCTLLHVVCTALHAQASLLHPSEGNSTYSTVQSPLLSLHPCYIHPPTSQLQAPRPPGNTYTPAHATVRRGNQGRRREAHHTQAEPGDTALL